MINQSDLSAFFIAIHQAGQENRSVAKRQALPTSSLLRHFPKLTYKINTSFTSLSPIISLSTSVDIRGFLVE
jgi:hypothetical protein